MLMSNPCHPAFHCNLNAHSLRLFLKPLLLSRVSHLLLHRDFPKFYSNFAHECNSGELEKILFKNISPDSLEEDAR